MWNVLILASASESGHGLERAGDLFDTALVEAVRVLDIPATAGTVLAPWSPDLAPLVAAATLDTAPSFDPENPVEGRSRSALQPYLPPGAIVEENDPFYRATHFALGSKELPTFVEALRTHPPTHVLVLSATTEFGALREFLKDDTPILAFASLTPTKEVAANLKVEASRIVNLEERVILLSEREDIDRYKETVPEREWETDLEPSVAFGLLVQDYFDQGIPDDEWPAGIRE